MREHWMEQNMIRVFRLASNLLLGLRLCRKSTTTAANGFAHSICMLLFNIKRRVIALVTYLGSVLSLSITIKIDSSNK